MNKAAPALSASPRTGDGGGTHTVSLGQRPIKLVRINSRLNVGGIARHVAWLTAGLEPVGFDSVLVTGTVPPNEEDMIPFVHAQGVEPLIIPEMSREISVKDMVTIWKLYRLFVRLHPALVHTHAAKAGAVGRMAGLLYRWLTPRTLLGRPRPCRFVHTYHGHIFHSYYGPVKTWLFVMVERLLAKLVTDRIVVISPQQYHEIHERFGVGSAAQFAMIPLGLDLGAFAGWPRRRHIVRDELGAGENDILVGIVGRLTEIKDHGLFLRMAARFRQDYAEAARRVRFLVIGNGHLRNDLEVEARALGLEKAISFLGMRDDPQNFYPALDVIALTSRNEGTPLTLIEGMANARPAIATNVGGVIDLVGPLQSADESAGWGLHDRGILVQPGDPVAFSNGLLHLVQNSALRRGLGERGQAFVERNYAKDRLLCDMSRLYDDLLNPQIKDGAAARRGRYQPLAKAGDPCMF